MKPIMRAAFAVLAFALLPSEVLAQFDQALGEIVRIREREHMIVMTILIVVGLGFLLAIVSGISRAMRKEKKRNRKKTKKRNRAKHHAAFATEESAPKVEAESTPKAEVGLVNDKKMTKKIGIALALTLHVSSIIFGGGIPYPLLLVTDIFLWFFTMFFVARAVHRPWREGRIAAASFFVVGCLITTFMLPGVGLANPLFVPITWVVATYFVARDINRRVKRLEEEKKEEKKRKKREKKRQAAEQHAQEPVEQPVQESVEEHAQAPVEQHTEEEQ